MEMNSSPSQQISPPNLVLDSELVLPPTLRTKERPGPMFGDTSDWPLHSLGVPANHGPAYGLARIGKFRGHWNYIARILTLFAINPKHRMFQENGIIELRPSQKLGTIHSQLDALATVQRFADQNQLTTQFGSWSLADVESLLASARDTSYHLERRMVDMLRRINSLAAVLKVGFRFAIPSMQRSRDLALKTKPISPEDFLALLHNCWIYITTIGPDILKAADELKYFDHWKDLDTRPPSFTSLTNELNKWLESKDGYIPLHVVRNEDERFANQINWNGIPALVSPTPVADYRYSCRETWKEKINQAIQDGVPTHPGITHYKPSKVKFSDGSVRTWCSGFDRKIIKDELFQTRNAILVFVMSMTMMRSSEAMGILKDSISTRDGAPVVKSRVAKHRAPEGDEETWWISEPVEQAIRLAEKLTMSGSYLFSDIRTNKKIHLPHPQITSFIQHTNELSSTGLFMPVKDSHIHPHRLRRTMAVITFHQPDGELALKFSLKHNHVRAFSNFTTAGYGAPNKAWTDFLELEAQDAVATSLVADWSNYSRADSLEGPGAGEFNKRVDRVNEQIASAPHKGDDKMLRNLLRSEFSTLRLGTFSHCLGDLSQAKCLENRPSRDSIPAPLPSYCDPTSCKNAVITEQHLPLWNSEIEEMEKLLKDSKMASGRREQLRQKLKSMKRAISSSSTKRR